MNYKKILINFILILGFMLIASANVFVQEFSNLDEIWIYNFGRCIVNGLLPYKDFSIIITPLFAYISAFFLKLFGDEMIVLRFAEVIQISLVLFMIYKILDRLKVNKGISLLSAMGIYMLYSTVFCFDYNWAVLLVSLVIIYMELMEEEILKHSHKRDIAIGLLAGIAILLKQTSGIVLSAVVIGYKFFEIRSKKDLKEFINIAATRLLGMLIPILLFAIYLSVNNIWTEFIDYTILGITTFSNKVPYTQLLEKDYTLAYAVPILLGVILIIAIITLALKSLKTKEWAKNLRILAAFDIATAVVVYPIADRMHFAVSTICTLLTLIYLVHVWIVYGLKIESKKINYAFNTFFTAIAILVFIVQIGFSVNSIIQYIDSLQGQKYFKHFTYIKTPETLYESLGKVGQYALEKENEGKNVIILDSMAAAINIPIDKYYKNYDMFNLGNFGAKGEDGIIEDLKYRKDTLMLVKKAKYKNNWQHPDKIIEFVRGNFNKVDEIEVFDVYSKY